MSTFPNRRWLVIPAEEVPNINFGQVIEAGPDSLRYSLDGTKTFVKYEIKVVEEDQVIETIQGETNETGTYTVLAGTYGRPEIYSEEYPEYNHEEILTLLSGEEWTNPYPMTGSFSNS
jgi:hypothetical protein